MRNSSTLGSHVLIEFASRRAARNAPVRFAWLAVPCALVIGCSSSNDPAGSAVGGQSAAGQPSSSQGGTSGGSSTGTAGSMASGGVTPSSGGSRTTGGSSGNGFAGAPTQGGGSAPIAGGSVNGGSGNAGSGHSGASGGAAQGGSLATSGAGGSSAGAAGGTSLGGVGGTSSAQSGAGGGNAGAGGSNAGAGGAAGNGSSGVCPTALPALAGDQDTAFYANANVQHGAVETKSYDSSGKQKNMHVYTPPDYASNTSGQYPVLYLNHGGGDDDAKWSCTSGGMCGYAGLILDNLIAAGKAVPMIVVMPNTSDCASLTPAAPPTDDACTVQYRQAIIPFVEKTYRVKADRNYRAIAGLSMGGAVVLNTGLPHLDIFAELYVYSSGYTSAQKRSTWEKNMSGVLQDAAKTNGLLNVPLYMAAGDSDIALPNATPMMDTLKKAGIKTLWQQSSGGHEWMNWRRYLQQTAQLMFKNTAGCD